MNIDITAFFRSPDVGMSDISGSRMEHGQDAARITWANANKAAETFAFLDTDAKRDAMRSHLKAMGFSEPDEPETPDDELDALLLQCVAGDIREVCSDEPEGSNAWWHEFEAGAEAGRYAGRMYRGDDGRVYYYLGD